MADVVEDVRLAIDRLRSKRQPKAEGWAEHAFKAALRHEKRHPECVQAQKESETISNENLDRRLRQIERKLGLGVNPDRARAEARSPRNHITYPFSIEVSGNEVCNRSERLRNS